ncbi:methylated-DNA--[protein]-cysteine S-methyltransferase [Azospira inquinata]|uniref:Methylated-DNA--[protein]-cysteine S-methyltransferase n=1 Tax=Azospira inquinata TaxID=2785627 RepID=A0A975XTS5_9RHOO|nr:methylated-DNA--[protein]-cysteine S-methyltransferase [Azospira inquinata]QWT46630.1 methylated-DNA--[protein]-cysteine S-methyltransferase [Azospira inquinata]QWT48048.1 methylated-DNA--[protein]-cysteine S-methyltransferase [Azospira inquinata]
MTTPLAPSSAPEISPSPGPFQAVVAAPGFALGLRCEGESLTGIHFLPPGPARAGTTPLAREAARQLAAYLQDARFAFDLPLAPRGTPFQHRVWLAIAAIPLGQTQSYGELARALTSSPRAVGGACGANPLPLVVPCHRVIAQSGRLNGFAHEKEGQGNGFYLNIKRWLLAHEIPERYTLRP